MKIWTQQIEEMCIKRGENSERNEKIEQVPEIVDWNRKKDNMHRQIEKYSIKIGKTVREMKDLSRDRKAWKMGIMCH